jgi:TRAP-type C4-dicarboxylate transport system permease small subunit
VRLIAGGVLSRNSLPHNRLWFSDLEGGELMLKFIHKLNRAIVVFQENITAILLLMMVVSISLQILLRYIFSVPTPWAEESAKYLFIWITYIGAAGMLIKGEHLYVDALYNLFNPFVKRLLRVAFNLGILAFCTFVFVCAFKLVSNPIIINSKTPVLQISPVWFYICLPISMFFMILFELGDTLDAIVCLVLGKDKRADALSVSDKEKEVCDG